MVWSAMACIVLAGTAAQPSPRPRVGLLALNAVQAVAGGVEHVPDIDDRRPLPFRDRREIAFDDVRRRTGAGMRRCARPRADARALSSSVSGCAAAGAAPTTGAISMRAAAAALAVFCGLAAPALPCRPRRPIRPTPRRSERAMAFGSSVCSVLVHASRSRSASATRQDPGGRPSCSCRYPAPGAKRLYVGRSFHDQVETHGVTAASAARRWSDRSGQASSPSRCRNP